MVTLTWHAGKYKAHKPHRRYILFTYRSLLLCLCDFFLALINSLVSWYCTGALDLILFQIAINK